MRNILAMIAVASLFASPSFAASQCKNEAGRFIKCPDAKVAAVTAPTKTAALTKTTAHKTAVTKTAAVSKMTGKKGPCRDAHGRFAKCVK